MIEKDNLPHFEEVLPETLSAINSTVDLKFNNPEILHRVNNTIGKFTLIDSDLLGNATNIKIQIVNFENDKLMRFIEEFNELTPGLKPSFLVYDYDLDLDNGTIQLVTTEDASELGLLARERLTQLKAGSGKETGKDGEIFQPISESQAKNLLTSVQEMKILID